MRHPILLALLACGVASAQEVKPTIVATAGQHVRLKFTDSQQYTAGVEVDVRSAVLRRSTWTQGENEFGSISLVLSNLDVDLCATADQSPTSGWAPLPALESDGAFILRFVSTMMESNKKGGFQATELYRIFFTAEGPKEDPLPIWVWLDPATEDTIIRSFPNTNIRVMDARSKKSFLQVIPRGTERQIPRLLIHHVGGWMLFHVAAKNTVHKNPEKQSYPALQAGGFAEITRTPDRTTVRFRLLERKLTAEGQTDVKVCDRVVPL